MATTKRKSTRRVQAKAEPAKAQKKSGGAKKGFAITFLIVSILIIFAGIGAVVYGGATLLMTVGLTAGSEVLGGLVLGTGLVVAFIYIAVGIVAIILGSIISKVCVRALRKSKI